MYKMLFPSTFVIFVAYLRIMMNYRKTNNLVGWITGAIAYIVYLKTMEPTVSFWDCGEFLSCAYKLEVGHSPGAPFFMLVQRLFSLFSGHGALTGQPNPAAAAFINSLSALTSALTILFLFWTTTYFAKRLLAPKDEPDQNQKLLIMGCGLVGALAYTFSDTFWFSAVEAEVYGTSSFFTAITFWAVLKWERQADEKYADRWLVLIAYLIGVSVCVHLLNLLTIPAVAMVYYFRRYKPTILGTSIAFVAGCLVLAFVQFGVIQYIPKIAASFDVLFTNSFHTPFDVGAATFLVLLAISLVALVVYTIKRSYMALYGSIAAMVVMIIGGFYEKPVTLVIFLVLLGGVLFLFKRLKDRHYDLVHTSVLSILFIIIGYSSYFSAIIRSRADVPIDMTNPDNPNSFLSYVDREQFGEQPIFFGPYYNSVPASYDTSENSYYQTLLNGKDYYAVGGKKTKEIFEGDQKHFFPRIYDREPGHVKFYQEFTGLGPNDEPGTAENLRYFVGYQMDWMWWRYFMWNFAGRQNDVEGQGDPKHGNWISGIPLVDNNIRGLGDLTKMSPGFGTTNDACNRLYFLPFILGIFGIIYQIRRNKNDFIVVLVLFFFTGAAIGIYLNMPPNQPRERDYAFAGCTYTYCIWIGLGVLLINDWVMKIAKGNMAAFASIGLSLIAVPALMAKEEWNDHDRSHKTIARAIAYNTLISCDSNAVLFAYGDNQTYPLWYLQEVEGIRRDVRIINTSLLGIDWYIDQLNYKINDADAVPMIWKREDYIGDHHNVVPYYGGNNKIPKDKYFNLADICGFMVSNDPANRASTQNGSTANYMPSKNFFCPSLSKDELVRQGIVSAADTAKITTDMRWEYPKGSAYKGDLAVLNIIAAVAKEGWKRPLYFDAGLRTGDYGGTGDYLRLEGFVYHLLPFKYVDGATRRQPGLLGSIDLDKSYDLFMNKFLWGGAETNQVYFDEPNRHELHTLRSFGANVASALAESGQKDKAVALVDKVLKGITEHSYYYSIDLSSGDIGMYWLNSAYYKALDSGAHRSETLKKAHDLTVKIVKTCEDDINWVNTLHEGNKAPMAEDVNTQISIMYTLAQQAYQAGDTVTAKNISMKVQQLAKTVEPLLQKRGANNGGGNGGEDGQ
jgi:Protein of unknown function (DUF2723)